MNIKSISVRLIGFYLLLSMLTLFFISCSENGMMDDDPCANGPELSLEVNDAFIGEENGSVTLNISGGTSPFEASLDGADFQSVGSFDNLAPGNYSVTVRDAEGCEASESFTISEVDPCASGPEISLETTASFDTENSGTIEISVSGGQSPYMYKLGDGEFAGASSFSSLPAGTYTVTVQDDNGCTSETTAEIQEVPFVSYQEDIKVIVETHCLLSGCHGDSQSLPNWGDLSILQANAERVKTRTSNGSMPPSNTPGEDLSDEQIEQIANWVDAGAPDN